MALDAFRFKDTVFLKNSNDLQERFNALQKLNEEYPNNEEILSELFIIKKGLDGEDEISYQLKKANIGMYVLRDIKLKYEDLTAQIDYIVITPYYTYYIECKNMVGNITVTDKGDFIRELIIKGKKIKKGMYSPLRQVEQQREVVRKIWNSKATMVNKLFGSKNFDYFRRVLVVAANKDTIINTDKAPKDIKYKVLRADSLVRQLNYDIEHRGKDDYRDSQNGMKEIAESYLKLSLKENIDYYLYYKNKFNLKEELETADSLKDRLLELRKERSNSMNIPAYYIFTNDELDKLVELRPKSIEELKNANILTPIKIKVHGEKILEEINRQTNN